MANRFENLETDPQREKRKNRFSAYEIDPNKSANRFASHEIAAPKNTEAMSVSDYVEAAKNKTDSLGSFFKGFTHAYDEYAATVNKGLDWVADKVAGHDTHYFDDGINYWNVKRRQNEIETENHPYAKLAGSLLLDPLNFTPTGVVSKGSKLARIVKSAAMGVPVGYGVSAVKNYGNTDISEEDKTKENIANAGLVGVLNGVIAGLTKGKVTNAIKDIEHMQGDGKEMADKAIEALANNPEAFGLSKAQAKMAADNYENISAMKRSRASKKEASKMFSVFHNGKAGTVVKADGGDIHVTPEIAEKIRSKHLDDPAKRGMVTTSEAISFPKVARNAEPETLRQGETWIAQADDGSKLVYGVGEWDGSKKLKTIHSKTEKGERGQLHREFNDRDFHDSALPNNSITHSEEHGQDIFSNNGTEETIAPEETANANLDTKDVLFANPAHNLAVGFGTGTYNSYSALANGEYDPRRDLSEQIAERFIEGMAMGMLGAQSIRLLAKHNPKAFEKVRQYFIDNDIKPGDDLSKHQGVSLGANPLEAKYLSRGYGGERVNESALMREAATLPKPVKSYQEFKKNFGWDHESKYYYIDTPIGQVKSNPSRSWRHLTDNSHYDNRGYISGAFFETMKDPLFIVKKPYDGGWSTVFYKPFKDEKGKYHLGAFAVGDNGELVQKTFYEIGGLKKIKDLIKVPDSHMLYYKYGDQPGVHLQTADSETSHIGNVEKAGATNDIIPRDDGGVKIGVFAGDKAVGYKDAKASGKVFDGKYDNMPRFEIDDSTAKIKVNNTKYGVLEDVLHHPELFKNYPEMRDIPTIVEIDKNIKSPHAKYTPFQDRGPDIFPLDEQIEVYARTPEEAESELLHEIQHAIQTKEGFAGGGSYEDMLRRVESKIYNLEKRGDLSPLESMRYSEELNRLKENKSAEAFDLYKKIAGEIEAREVQARQHLTPEERDIIPPYENADTLSENGSPEAYNAAFMARLEGRHGDFDSAGISPDEATLDFSRSRADMAPVKSKEQKEKRGIYNVTFNGKESTVIRNDDLDALIRYERGNGRYGAIHILKHLDDGSVGEVSKEELLKIGDIIRNGKMYGSYGKRVYEINENGVRYRVVVGKKGKSERVITFYSDRNLPARDGYDIPQITDDLAGSKKIIPDNDNGVKIGMFAGDVPKLRKNSADGKLSHLSRIVEEETSKEWKDISNTLIGDARRLFTDTFSGEYIKARDVTNAAKHRAAEKATLIHNTLSKLPEQDRKMLHEYIVGDIHADMVPESIRAIGDNIRQTVTDVQQQLIDAGFSEEMINAWGANYLKRIYDIHPVKDFKKVMTKKMTVPQLLRRGKEETVTKEELQRRIASGEIDREMIGKPLKEGGIEIKDLGNGKLKVRRDWTKAEREQMGEITDAAVTIPQTIVHLHNILEHAKFLKEVSGIDGATIDPKIAKTLTDDELSSIGFVRVPNTRKYGALAGQAVRKDVFADIKALNDNVFDTYFGHDNAVAKAFKQYLRLWKKSKTVWNAPTHLNNITSNFFLMHLAGLNPAEILGNVASAGKMMWKGKRLTELESKAILNTLSESERAELNALNSELKYYKEAKDLGLLNTSFLEDIGHTNKEVTDAKTVLGKVDKTLTGWYQNEDAVNKLAMYKFLREHGWAKEKSREAVETIMPDYSRPMAQGWRFLRDTGVTPFIAWTYYTFPKMWRLIKSWRGATQAATALGALYGIQYATTGVFNPMDDSIPDDFKLSRIGISRDGDKITTLKADRMVPYMQPLNPVRFGRDMVGSGVWQTALSALMGTKIYNGRPITNEYKPKSQQAYDYIKYITQGLTPIPGQVSSTWDTIESLARSKSNRVRSSDIVPRTTNQELWKLLGINTLTYDKRKVERERKQKERRARRQ